MPAGQPTAFREEFIEQAAKLVKLGATDIELADFFEVSARTLYRWKNEHEEFCQTLKIAKDEADSRVERSLYERATGYERDSVKIFCQDGAVIEHTFREHVPPDTTAMIFWLKNRKSDVWRDRRETELTGKDGGAIQIVSTIPRPPKE